VVSDFYFGSFGVNYGEWFR